MTDIEKTNKLNKAVMMIKNHCMSTQCTDCMFNNSDYDCFFEFGHRPIEWETLTLLSEREKQALSFIPEEFKWMARDEDGTLCTYTDEPPKGESIWQIDNGNCEILTFFKELFQFIQWEDEEPVSLDELRKICDE